MKDKILKYSAPVALSLSLAACGGSGNSTEKPVDTNPIDPVVEEPTPTFNDEDIVSFYESTLSDSKENHSVLVSSNLDELVCDVYGSYFLNDRNRNICLSLSSETSYQPKASVDGVDYVLSGKNIQEESDLDDSLNNLRDVNFNPMYVGSFRDFGEKLIGTSIEEDFSIRGTDEVSGNCDINSAEGDFMNNVTLKPLSSLEEGLSSLQFSKENISLPGGNYILNCNFNDSKGDLDISLGKFSVNYIEKPSIEGIDPLLEGIVGEELLLGGSCKDYESNELELKPTSVTYDTPGTYAVERSCTDVHGLESSINQDFRISCPADTSWDGNSCKVEEDNGGDDENQCPPGSTYNPIIKGCQ